MALFGFQLRIVFGLGHDPSSVQVQAWVQLTRALASQGLSLEAAGHRAAKQLFVDYGTHVYASEGDTIETLLRLAEQR